MSNVKADDWESHWSAYAESAESNPAQHMRHDLILRTLESDSSRVKTLLDIGSGQGDFLALAVRSGVAEEYAGFELSETGVREARKKVPKAQFLQIDLFAPPPEAEKFLGWASCVTCSEVIEHVDDPVGFVRSISRYLSESGLLVVTVPGGPMSHFDHHIGHRRHYTKKLITDTLTSAGFTVEKVWFAGFPFFNLYRLLVILRGRRLISDVERGESRHASSGVARTVMRVFDLLFRANLRSSPFGWQVAAVARKRQVGKTADDAV